MAFTLKQRISLTLIPPVAAALIRLLGSTLRFNEVHDPNTPAGDTTPLPGVFGFWHRSLLLAAYRFRNQQIGILISSSFDGELIARTVKRLGFIPLRGSSSRGGASGLLAMQNAVRSGKRVAFTADGPRGPVYIAKPGFAHLAQSTTGWAGAFHLSPQNAWTIKSWDRFLIPKPFTRVTVSWPAHITLPADVSIEEATALTQQMLDHAVAMTHERSANS